MCSVFMSELYTHLLGKHVLSLKVFLLSPPLLTQFGNIVGAYRVLDPKSVVVFKLVLN